jgi:hypothetical protein
MVTVFLYLESSYSEGFERSTQGYRVTAEPWALYVVGNVVTRDMVPSRRYVNARAIVAP